MYFFLAMLLSIAVMTYIYVHRVRNLCPTNLLRTPNKFQHATAPHSLNYDPTVV